MHLYAGALPVGFFDQSQNIACDKTVTSRYLGTEYCRWVTPEQDVWMFSTQRQYCEFSVRCLGHWEGAMRNTSALHWTLLIALLTSPVGASAQHTTDDQEAVASLPRLLPDVVFAGHAGEVSYAAFSPDGARILTVSSDNAALAYRLPATTDQPLRGDSESRALYNLVISADGAWMAAEEHPDRGEGNVRVWSTDGDATFTIERGQDPRISRESRWVSALQRPALEDSRAAAPKNERAGQTLVLLDTQDGSRRTFDFVLSYDLSYFSAYLVYLQSPEATAYEEEPPKNVAVKPAVKPVAKERGVGTLRVVELETGRVFTWKNVTQYAVHQTTDHGARGTWKENYAYAAFVTHDGETGRDRLEIAFVGHAKRAWGTGGAYEGETIEALRWARDSITLVFLDSTETTGKDGTPRVSSALYCWHDVRGRSGHREFTRVDSPR